jgi:uncharacterized membrane protein
MDSGFRNARERAIQTLWFEGAGLAIVVPLYSRFAAADLSQSFVLLAALSFVVMAWSVAFNAAFDLLERRWAGRVASDRPQRWRVVHAAGLEASAVLVTCPVICALTPMSWTQGLLANVALTLTYAVYGYAFHWVFDRLRPIARSRTEPAAGERPGDGRTA